MTRDHILAEIRRTTAANGGKPLGIARFEAETGIKRRDWHGKYWARWGDAMKDAGFEPNQLVSAYSDEYLLSALCSLATELGKFPVTVEIKMKARRTVGFPSATTFDRFGSKQQLAGRLRAFALQAGLSEVAELCPVPESESAESSTHESAPTRSSATDGHVYLLKSGRFYKIGRTNELGRRKQEIVVELPEPAEIIHSIATDDPAGIEAYWHTRFRDCRQNGEWFALKPDDIRAFRRRRFM